LKYSGLAIAGVGTAWLGKNLFRSPQKIEFTETRLSDTEYQFDVITVNDRGEEIKRELGKAKYFTEDLGNGITLEMVEIPGGTFMMGSSPSEKGRDDDESPQHQVTVPAFYMGKFQVTQEQWKAVASLPQVKRELKSDPSNFKGNKLPVESVSWEDVVEFCARLSKATGKEYRLPSEAEWEYACRAGTTTPFYFGETITTDLANYDGNNTYANEPKGKYREKTTEVGSFPPNSFGLYDMHGNVWEWCGDNYHENYQGAPNDGSVWIENNSSINVLRGGSWAIVPNNCRSADRYWFARVFILDYDLGFRCVVPRTS
jgi:formylglycine-generating enzyme required for sulfatase activity